MLPYLILLAMSNCRGELRDNIIREAFEKNNNAVIRAEDIDKFVNNLPWFAKTAFNLYFKPHGGSAYIVHRCGDNGVVTLESALKKVDTCVSKCLYLSILQAVV